MDEVARGDKMKEFEKWNKKHGEELVNSEIDKISDYINNERKSTWKGALECILDKCHHYQNQDVIDFIQEELEQ